MPDPLELEGKFACTAEDLELAAQLDRIGEFRLVERSARVQTDVYFDTLTLTLNRMSSSLRLREVESNTRATFKGPREAVSSAGNTTHLVKRLEIEVPVVPSPVDYRAFTRRVDIEPVARAREIIGDAEELQPLARLVTHRRMLNFKRGDTEEVELSLDNVEGLNMRDDREARIIEIELELIAGDEATLIMAATALGSALPSLRPSSISKLARVLGARD